MIKIQEQQDENPDDLNQSNSLQDLDVHLNLHSLKKGHPDRPVVSAYGARYHSADKIWVSKHCLSSAGHVDEVGLQPPQIQNFLEVKTHGTSSFFSTT